MNKIIKKNKLTIILLLVFIILLIINFLIPEKRTVTKILTAEEYKKQIYDEVYKEIFPEEYISDKTEENQTDDFEKEFIQNYLVEDEIYKVQE